MKVDVLNLEWSSRGRDREISSLICYSLRKMGYTVVEDCIFNWRYSFYKYQPKIFLISNTTGAVNNFELTKWAHLQGIPTITTISEGGILDEVFGDEFLWGHNKDKILYEDIYCQWSIPLRDFSVKLEPQIKNKVKVTGGAGFDRYRILEFMTKNKFLEKYKKTNFEKVVGYAAFTFDAFYRQDFYKEKLERFYSKTEMDRLKSDGKSLNKILRNLITNNPDVLFLLKEHPGNIDLSKSELHGLQNLPNVVYIIHELPIGDAINVCDIWAGYESTTCLEAWLLKKPTFLINPSGSDFKRHDLYHGSVVYKNEFDAQAFITEFYKKGSMKEFDNKEATRKQLIKAEIGWDDGKNHMRTAYYADLLLKKTSSRVKINHSFFQILTGYFNNLMFFLFRPLANFPFFKTRLYILASYMFNAKDIVKYYEKNSAALEKFHRLNSLSESDISELHEINND